MSLEIYLFSLDVKTKKPRSYISVIIVAGDLLGGGSARSYISVIIVAGDLLGGGSGGRMLPSVCEGLAFLHPS